MNGAWVWTTLTLLTGMLFYSFLLFNALRCLDSICQIVMFDDTNSLNVVIYLSQKKKKNGRGYFNYHKLLVQILANELFLKQLLPF